MTGNSKSGQSGSSGIETLRLDIIGARFHTEANDFWKEVYGQSGPTEAEKDAGHPRLMDRTALAVVKTAAEEFDLSNLQDIVVCKQQSFREAVGRMVAGAESDDEAYDIIPDELAGVTVSGYWRNESYNVNSYQDDDTFAQASSSLQRAAYQVASLDANLDEMAALAMPNEEVEASDNLAYDGVDKVPDVEVDAAYIVPDGSIKTDLRGIAEAAMENGVSEVKFANAEALGLIDTDAVDAYREEQQGGVTETETDDTPDFGGDDSEDPVEDLEGEELPEDAPEL